MCSQTKIKMNELILNMYIHSNRKVITYNTIKCQNVFIDSNLFETVSIFVFLLTDLNVLLLINYL